MFSKKICASLCALGLSLSAANIDTKVSAADTFDDIVATSGVVYGLWNYIKLIVGGSAFMMNQLQCEDERGYKDSLSYKVIATFSLFNSLEGFFGVINALKNEDVAKVAALEKIAKNDPVYNSTYSILRNYSIKLSSENVKDVMENVKMAQEALKKVYDGDLDLKERLLAKDVYNDAVKNLEKIAGKNSKDIDNLSRNDKFQLYKRGNH